MANIPLKSIKFPDLPDTYIINPTIAEVDGLQTALDEKADKTDVYNGFVSENIQGSIASFDDGADDIPVKSLVAEIVPVQSGSGDPSPDNVRAISGWSECNVSVAGINQWDEEWEVGPIDPSTGEKTIGDGYIRTKNYIKVAPNTEYYSLISYNNRVMFYDANRNFLSALPATSSPRTFTTPNNCSYVMFFAVTNTYSNDISINYPSTETAYHTGATTHAISFASAGTVYGGSIDVTSGVLTVDRIGVDMGTLDYVREGSSYYTFYTGSVKDVILKDMSKHVVQLSMFKGINQAETSAGADNYAWVNSGGYVNIKHSAYESKTANEFKQLVNGQLLVYLLATPQTYQLTLTEVKTLLGNNNVWADTGDIDLTYRADLGLYLDKIINA